MGIFGSKKREQALQAEIESLRSQLTPEQQNIIKLKENIAELEKSQTDAQAKLFDIQQQLSRYEVTLAKQAQEIEDRKIEIFKLDDDIDMQSYGIYSPTFTFANSDLYKDRLKEVRNEQKMMIRQGEACTGNMGWTVNGSKSQGEQNGKGYAEASAESL